MPGYVRDGTKRKGKRLDGTTKWEAVWRNPLNQVERRSRTFRRKDIAQRWLTDMDSSAYSGSYVDPRRTDRPLSQVASEWQESWLNLEPKTKAGYEHILRKHVLPTFGLYRVGSLNAEAIQKWVNGFASTHAPKTVNNVYGVLRGLLRFAVERRNIGSNPCEAVRLPKQTSPREKLFLAPAEVRQLAEAMPAHYRIPVYVAAYVGLRAGELWALRRRDVDLIHGVIRVERALKEINTSAAGIESGMVFGAPKSQASKRQVSMPAPIRALLIEYLAQPLPGGSGADDLIFTTPSGRPVRHNMFYKRVFRPRVIGLWPEGHRLHALRWHDLRHTCAALSLSVAPNLVMVKERLGHESIRTTVDIYGGLLPSVDAALSDGLAQLFNGASTPPDNVTPLRGEAAHRATDN